VTAFADHERRGDGEPLLLIHGFTATWRVWQPVLDSLDGFDVLAPTLPGHTGGPRLDGPVTVEAIADGLEAMLDEVGWSDAHVAGFSLGGWLTLELAKRGRARTATPICPAGAPGLHSGAEARRVERVFRRGRTAARRAGPRIERLARSPRMRRLMFRDQMVHGERVDPAVAVRMTRDFVATPIFDALLADIDRTGGVQDLGDVTVPVHLVWGTRDRIIPVRHAAWFQEQLPYASLRLIDDAGHVPFWDAPQAFADEIRRAAKTLVS